MEKEYKPAPTRFSAYVELTKPRITLLVVITTALGFYLGGRGFNALFPLISVLFGTGLVSSGAGAINHYMERETDRLMIRTRNRPIPAGILQAEKVFWFGFILIFSGVFVLLSFVNLLTSFMALLTAFLYIFVYTPLKKVTWLNTSIGAIPGSIPPLGGWVAATGQLDQAAWALFAIMYLWQHPHFYAIAQLCKQDYARAGLQMLPVLEDSLKRTNRQILWHSALLIPISVLPSLLGISGSVYFLGAGIMSIGYMMAGLPLFQRDQLKRAKFLLKASVIYLPALFALIIIDLAY